MAETHVLSALKRRYALTLGRIAHGEGEAGADLIHLAAVIHMFNPAEDLSAIQRIRPYKPGRERWSRTVIKVLREANEPLRAREIARRVLRARGLDPNDHERMFSISCGLQAVLGRLAKRGLVTVTDKPRRRWAIARPTLSAQA